jgi:hypothetical protein
MTALPQFTKFAEASPWLGPVDVRADDAPVADFELTIGHRAARPYGPWSAPVPAQYKADDGTTKTGNGIVAPNTLPVGSYLILARYTTSLETEVMAVGVLNVV